MQKRQAPTLGGAMEPLPLRSRQSRSKAELAGKGIRFLALPLVSELAVCFIRSEVPPITRLQQQDPS